MVLTFPHPKVYPFRLKRKDGIPSNENPSYALLAEVLYYHEYENNDQNRIKLSTWARKLSNETNSTYKKIYF